MCQCVFNPFYGYEGAKPGGSTAVYWSDFIARPYNFINKTIFPSPVETE